MLAGDGYDFMAGADGNDLMFGGNGADVMAGEDGNDALLGEAGNDTLYGGAGNDLMDGGADMDTLYGEAGNDALQGYLAVDSADTGFRDSDVHDPDLLDGGEGNDTLLAGSGDTLTGGAGADMHVLGTWIDQDVTITDYVRGQDVIVLNYNAADTTPPVITLQQSGTTPADAEILIDGVVAAVVQGAHGTLTVTDVVLTPVADWITAA